MLCPVCEEEFEPTDPKAAFLLERTSDILADPRRICARCVRDYLARGYKRSDRTGRCYVFSPEVGEALLQKVDELHAIRAMRKYSVVLGLFVLLFFVMLLLMRYFLF